MTKTRNTHLILALLLLGLFSLSAAAAGPAQVHASQNAPKPTGAATPERQSIPDHLAVQARQLLTDYFELQSALSNDDAPEAARKLRDLRVHLARIDMKRLSHPVHNAWMQEHTALSKALGTSEGSRSLRDIRTVFARLHGPVRSIADRYELSLPYPVTEYRCPMVREPGDSYWLQNTKEPRNPYFGKAMLACAVRTGYAILKGQ